MVKGACGRIAEEEVASNILFLGLGHIKWQCLKCVNYNLYSCLHICELYNETFPSKKEKNPKQIGSKSPIIRKNIKHTEISKCQP